MNYREAVDWLFGVARFGMKLGLGNIRALLRQLELPDPHLRVIHVAGTNGKGSTCAFAHACLHAAGHRTGLFTSPHLIDFRERIRVGHDLIPEPDTARLLGVLKIRAEAMDPHPSFFEVTFALALLHFREAKVEFAVIETGLGGRLDATNVLTPDVSVITGIGFDHQQWLGDTLPEIAREKAGIIKPNVPAVSAPQDPDARAVLEEFAAGLDTPLTVIDPANYPPSSALGLHGEHQRENAALALAALSAAGLDLPAEAVERGLADVSWPARFQILTLPQLRAPLVIDGAHNAHAARILARTWQGRFPGEKATVIYSAADGKDVPAFLANILPVTGRLILTISSSSRARTPEDLHAELRGALPNLPETMIAADPAAALTLAENFADPVLVTGSLFLAGDTLSLLNCSASPDPGERL